MFIHRRPLHCPILPLRRFCRKNGNKRADSQSEVSMQLVLLTALTESLGAALAVERAIVAVCAKAIKALDPARQ
jgi:hypothetical protein